MFKKSIFFIILIIKSCWAAFAFDAGVSNHIPTGTRWHDRCIGGLTFLPQDTVAPVKIQLEKTSFDDMSILFISDTAVQTQDLGPTFSKDYAELMRFVQQNQLAPKKFLAWYYSTQSPWIMDIAVETDKIPSELKGRISSRIEKGGEVLIAHMWGPYSELSRAYMQIKNWLKENSRIARGAPFEVYLNDPSIVKDPSEIKTDIYQPLQ
jgi:effector-binding domain-containing protein